jgi:hypothetical protein
MNYGEEEYIAPVPGELSLPQPSATESIGARDVAMSYLSLVRLFVAAALFPGLLTSSGVANESERAQWRHTAGHEMVRRSLLQEPDAPALCYDIPPEVIQSATDGILSSCRLARPFCEMDPRLPVACALSCGRCPDSVRPPEVRRLQTMIMRRGMKSTHSMP